MTQPVQLVFGLGTGRCGTQSLAVILNEQHLATVTHERRGSAVAWHGGEKQVERLVEECRSTPGVELAGDVAFYYLPYVERILSMAPAAKFICMQRDRKATVKSYLRWTEKKNYWVHHNGIRWKLDEWDRCYPKYTLIDKSRAIGQYWDDYYERARELAAVYPQSFLILPTDALNTNAGQNALFDFLRHPAASRRIVLGVHVNRAGPSRAARFLRKCARALHIRRAA